ncbi:MAG: flavin monoamine oxidase family protein, partial [Streptosporangiaceae bacterium]
RDLLRGAGAAGSAAAAAAVTGSRVSQAQAASRPGQPRIVIVGAGAAGIRCAHLLYRRHGWRSAVYEWDDHPGGRIETLRGFFSGGQIAEMHGEFISSEHSAMLDLVRHFSLGLDDTSRYPAHTADTYWFRGRRYTQAALNADWKATCWRAFHRAVRTVPWPQTYDRHSAAGRRWDEMSVPEWMQAHLPGGAATDFGQLCLQDVLDEFGGDPSGQSALNLTMLLGYDDSAGGPGYQPRNSPVLAGTDERWHITGGNDQVITGMLGQLPAGTVRYGHRLVAVRRRHDGSLTGTFSCDGQTREVTADRFVFALPFSTLRHVDLGRAGLSRLKLTAIRELGYGTNSKIIVQTSGRPWTGRGYTGNFFTDRRASSGWELNYQRQGYASPDALLLAFPAGQAVRDLAGRYGLRFGHDEGRAPAAMAADYLRSIEPVLPGVTAAWNGKAYYNIGLLDPHILGAWSYWRTGQYTRFAGYEGVTEGRAHFCGEHTEQEFQGFMEGAVRSGRRAAGEIGPH